ncbi:MAG TPA: carboxylesterase [Myxococcales bacterium]|nr:carboxylesterase [Myxococcales bacterium]
MLLGITLLGTTLLGTLHLGGCASSPPASPPTADPATARKTTSGPLVGYVDEHGVHTWLGIPFAQAPVGQLRWQAPRPPLPWTERREALGFGAECIQFAGPVGSEAEPGSVVGSEDCLFLNIFAPARGPSEGDPRSPGLPVMVWIHGGGNTVGSARPYNGSALARQERVIVVTLQYRLGVFGWLSHPGLRPPGTSALDGSGNYGTLDLIRGLEWVRDEIAVFGGDPDRVTVFGESAGGTNVLSLLLAPPARGLFHRAISESGSLSSVARVKAEDYADAEAKGHARSSGELLVDLLQADGGAKGRADAQAKLAGWPPAEVGEYLRGKSPEQLMALFDGEGLAGMYWVPQVIRDGAVIPHGEPLEVLRSGAFPRVPVILGTNRDEVKLFAMMGTEHVTRAFGIPLWLNDERAYQLETEFPSRMWKVRGVDDPARAMVGFAPGQVFAYRFDWDEERKLGFADLSKMVGAGHAVEIPFVFGGLNLGGRGKYFFDSDRLPAAEALSRAIMSYWAEFARSGDPGGGTSGTLPRWQAWDATGPNGVRMMILDTPADGGLRMSRESVTREGVLAEIASDPRFLGTPERCEVYRSLAQRGDSLSRAEYAAVLDGGCAAYPLADWVAD